MLVRRIGSQVLISFDHKQEAKSFFAFMKKRNDDSIFLEMRTMIDLIGVS